MKLGLVLAALFALVVKSHGARHLQPALPPFEDRIIGGQSARIEEVPYQIALLSYGGQICGGSIISEYWVLTAAHCVSGQQASALTVVAGTAQWAAGGVRRGVDLIIMHPQYNVTVYADYDYALVLASSPIPIGSPTIQAVSLAWSSPAEGAMAIVSGWGKDRVRIANLKKTNVPVVGRARCRELIGNGVTDRMICAGWPQGGDNTCQGDSGGPLVVNGEQVGIVSWAYGCANPYSPTVFADVANQRNWIWQHTGV